jgi:hypothetical protein
VKLGRYPVVVRLANGPGELMSDAASTQTGLPIKVLAVEGEMLPRGTCEVTQGFVLRDCGRQGIPGDAPSP